MRRLVLILMAVLLAISFAGNALLGWMLWRAQSEYRALAKQFVKTRQELAAARTPPAAGPAKPQSTAPQAPAPQAPAPAPTPVAAPAPTPQGASPSPPAPANGPTVESIRAQYTPRLQAVQAQCEGQLNAMLETAKAEYAQAKAAGGTVDVAAMGAKYLARADGLRRQCDRDVNTITAAMAGDLGAAGLPLDLVDEVRAAYESRIIERQAEIMAKAPQ